MLKLSQDDVHVWYAYTDRCRTPELQRGYFELLNEEERQRHAGFAFDELKLEYLLTRALCRITLSRYADVAPQAWQFDRSPLGRPSLASPQSALGLSFNLSNTRSLVGIAVARCNDEVGLDIEEGDRATAWMEIAARFFSRRELAALESLPADRRQRRFFDLWTLKESYIKARGKGLSMPLDAFSIAVEGEIGIVFEPSSADEHPQDWQFVLRRLGARHHLAVCLRRPPDRPALVALRETVPGSSDDGGPA